MEIKKCAMGVVWTSGLTALGITFLLFTLFDPGDAATVLKLPMDPGEFRIQAYLFMGAFVWMVLISSVAMNCFYRTLREGNCGCRGKESDKAEAA